MPTRLKGQNVSVFTLGGTALVGDVVNANIEIAVATQEGKGVADNDNFPIAVGRALKITGELQCSGSVVLMGSAYGGTAVSFSVTTGAGTYSGTAVVTSISHRIEREGIQSYNVTLDSQGAVTVTI